jgi:hypothetical protein
MKPKALKQATDQFIAKRLKQNKPFQSLVATQEYKDFHAAVKDAIGSQIKAVSHNLQMPTDYWIDQTLPPLQNYLTVQQVQDYLVFCFEWGVRAQYKRFGLKVKANSPHFAKVDAVEFKLTNEDYLAALADDANYLINLSSIDATTRQQIIDLIEEGTSDGLTMDEVASYISDNIDDISDARANLISRTETAQAMGAGNYASMVENGVQTKHWVTAGASVCAICQGNADQGSIGVNESFDSGDDYEPAHPNCECYTEADEIDLESIDIWGGE